ncbi:MAG: hypothetical protein IPI91_02720 [Flavobacteriales bacterium]|nr:hypothetical protein [Flavobacteriales bacterium]
MKKQSHVIPLSIELNEHEQCAEIFENLFLTSDGNSVGCDIWRALVGDERLYDNCLGENFNQLLHTIHDDWFGNSAWKETSIEFYNTTYIFWLYLVVARVNEVFDTIDPKGTNQLVQKKRRSLSTFHEINLWAIFSKHPKEFIYAHWPEASCEGRTHSRTRSTAIRINTAYLKAHYSSESDKRPIELKNHTNVVVEYPKLTRLTEGLGKDFLAFRDFICKNEMVIDELKKDTNVPFENVR